ncbi:MAG: uroporphyrinogen decarboxylase [Firmicutes bacterium]|nr:uroporphyrinogen decarboxylase [Bacillota bacterium]
MTALERVSKTLRLEEPDRVPVYPILSGVTRHLVNASYREWATNAEICAAAYIKAAEQYRLDVICTLTDLSVEAADFGAQIVYPENEAAHPEFGTRRLAAVEDYRTVQPVDPHTGPRMSEHIKLCQRLVEAKGKEIPIVAFTFGPLGITSMLRGQEEFFMDLILEPEAVKYAIAAVTETLMDYYDALMDTGVHAIMMDTLFASESIMSKSMWLEFEGEYVRRLAERVHERGCMMMVHNCGNGIYFDAQIETMQPEAISFLHLPDDVTTPAELKKKYGHQTTLIGHVDPTWIVQASEDEVRDECKKQIDLYKQGGGYILATGCEYPANADLRNAEVMVETAETYGRYA